jgi:prepilin-type N-terminal cleavage/methylation domain-containing protein
MAQPVRRFQRGFTLIEMMVALVLVGVLGLIGGGFLLPMKMSRDANAQSQALSYARSYLEIIKGRWLDANVYKSKTLPTWKEKGATTPLTADVEVPVGWAIVVPEAASASTAWADANNIRTVTVKITSPNQPDFTLSSEITRPSYE